MKYLFSLVFIFSTNVLAEVTSKFNITIDNQCNAPVKIFHKRYVIGHMPGYASFVANCSEGNQQVSVGKTVIELPGFYVENGPDFHVSGSCGYYIEPEWSISGEWGRKNVTPRNHGETMTCKGNVNIPFQEPCKCIY